MPVLLLVAGPVLWLVPQAGENRKLNGPLATPPVTGQVFDFELAPDGERVVYTVRKNPANNAELRSVPSSGSQVSTLLSRTADNVYPYGFGISSDGVWAVYQTQGEINSVPVDGSQLSVRLNPNLVSGGEVLYYLISPAGDRVVYEADQDVDDVFELYSAPIDGSASAVKLNPPLPSGRRVGAFQVSPDGTRVVYQANPDFYYEIFGAPIDGSQAAVKLNSPAGLSIQQFWISPDATRVVYVADGIFSVPSDASQPPVLLSSAPGVARISPDSRTVVIIADLDADGRSDIFSIPIQGGSPVRLNGPIVPGGSVVWFFQPEPIGIGPDGSRIVYIADAEVNNLFELYSAPIDGSASGVKLNGPLLPGRGVDEFFRFSPDSALVLYIAAQESDAGELYAVASDGSTSALKLNEPLLGGSVGEFAFSPDSSQVVYIAPQDYVSVPEVYRRPIDASAGSVKLTPTPPPGPVASNVGGFRATSDGSRVVYDAAEEMPGPEIHSVPTDGSGDPVQLTHLFQPPLPPFHTIQAYEITPDDSRVVVLALVQEGYSSFERLLSVPIDGSASPIELNPQSLPGILELSISPDSSRLSFVSSGDVYSVPLDGGQPPLRLDDASSAYGTVFGAGGSRIVYLAHQSGPYELYSVPSDGSQAPIRLSAAPVPGGDVTSFKLSPDGAVAVYTADQDVDERFELYSVPVDAHGPALKLSGTMIASGDVPAGDFAISPDSSRVVFRADRLRNIVLELFAVPIDGGIPPVKISGPMTTGGIVTPGFLISPDGQHVVYRADQDTDERFELYSAPGSVKLSGTLAPGTDVNPGFQISPDGMRVVYRTTGSELHSVLIDGSASPFTLSTVQSSFATFQISPDSSKVLFLAGTGPIELRSVPIDGALPAVALNDPFGTSGAVRTDFRILDSRRVLYRANPSGADELYLNERTRAARPFRRAVPPTETVLR